MAQKISQLADAVASLADATLIELPRLAIGRLLNSGTDDHELREAGWKAYDAGVAIATELTNRVYGNPRVGRVTGRALDISLKFQQLADAASGALFAALWPMFGLPTASDVRRLSDKVDSLREQMQSGAIGLETAHQLSFDRELPLADQAGAITSVQISPTIAAVTAEVKRYVSH